MAAQDLTATLGRLGLTTYEAKAYLALLRRDSSSAAEVARLGELPRQRIYDVLASLLEKGLASARPGAVAKYVATPPDAAVERLLAEHRERLTALEHEGVSAAQELAPAFHAGRAQTDPLEYIEVVRDGRTVAERFAELQKRVQNEILVFTKPPYARLPQENLEGLELARTKIARSIYEFSVFENAAFVEGVRTFVEAGEGARFVPELPLKLAIIDESTVMFGMEDPVGGAADLTMMLVEHPALARVLKIAFEAIWAAGLSFEEAQERFGLARHDGAQAPPPARA